MKRIILAGAMALLSGVTGLLAQQKQPTPKSPKEVEALQAMFNAPDPDARIKAAEDFLAKFADSEFKATASYLLAVSYEQKNNFEKMAVWSERTLEADPKNFPTMLMLASGIAKNSQEHDLDLEEKLTRSEKYTKSATDLLATVEKPNPNLTDDQWAAAKKDLNAQAHEIYGLIATLRKKNDVAVAEFKLAVEGASNPDPVTVIRLGRAYVQAGKPDEAIAVLDPLIASPDLPVQLKQFAQAERVRAVQAKGGAAKPPAPPANPAPAVQKD